MASCKHCGRWAGIFWDEHDDCRNAVENGLPVPSAIPSAPTSAASPLTFWRIVWAVVLGLAIFSLAAWLLYFLTH